MAGAREGVAPSEGRWRKVAGTPSEEAWERLWPAWDRPEEGNPGSLAEAGAWGRQRDRRGGKLWRRMREMVGKRVSHRVPRRRRGRLGLLQRDLETLSDERGMRPIANRLEKEEMNG